MKDGVKKDKRQMVGLWLLALSVLMTILVLVQVAGFYLDSAEARNVAEKAAAQTTGDAKDVHEHVARSKNVADELKQKNLFTPPIEKEHPVKEVQGILGSDVLIDGNLYKVGDDIDGARIVAVGSTTVTIEWEGQRKEFAPIAASSGTVTATVETPAVEEEPIVQATATPAQVTAAAPVAEDPFAWLGVEVSAAVKQQFMKRWSGLSPEQKARAKQEWGELTDEQKKQTVEKWKREM